MARPRSTTLLPGLVSCCVPVTVTGWLCRRAGLAAGSRARLLRDGAGGLATNRLEWRPAGDAGREDSDESPTSPAAPSPAPGKPEGHQGPRRETRPRHHGARRHRSRLSLLAGGRMRGAGAAPTGHAARGTDPPRRRPPPQGRGRREGLRCHSQGRRRSTRSRAVCRAASSAKLLGRSPPSQSPLGRARTQGTDPHPGSARQRAQILGSRRRTGALQRSRGQRRWSPGTRDGPTCIRGERGGGAVVGAPALRRAAAAARRPR